MFESTRQYYLYDEPTDMRKSFHTLGAIVTAQMGLSLRSGSGFVFINRRKTHLKMLLWEGDGFSLYFKRLEQGTFEHIEQLKNYELSYEKLLLVLRGIETAKIIKRKRFSL
ncbi:MAG: IS66 family insertion sequence element accessory protein TnpB [Cyanobacteria bacterium J06649_11]